MATSPYMNAFGQVMQEDMGLHNAWLAANPEPVAPKQTTWQYDAQGQPVFMRNAYTVGVNNLSGVQTPTLTEEQKKAGYFLMPYFSGVDTGQHQGGMLTDAYTPTGKQELSYFDVVPPNPTPSAQWRWNTFEKKWEDPKKQPGWKEELDTTMGIVIPAILSYATGGTVGAAAGSAMGGAAAGGMSSTISGAAPEQMGGAMLTGGATGALASADMSAAEKAAAQGAVTAGTSKLAGASDEDALKSGLLSGVGSYGANQVNQLGAEYKVDPALTKTATGALTGYLQGGDQGALAGALTGLTTGLGGQYGGKLGSTVAGALTKNYLAGQNRPQQSVMQQRYQQYLNSKRTGGMMTGTTQAGNSPASRYNPQQMQQLYAQYKAQKRA